MYIYIYIYTYVSAFCGPIHICLDRFLVSRYMVKLSKATLPFGKLPMVGWHTTSIHSWWDSLTILQFVRLTEGFFLLVFRSFLKPAFFCLHSVGNEPIVDAIIDLSRLSPNSLLPQTVRKELLVLSIQVPRCVSLTKSTDEQC